MGAFYGSVHVRSADGGAVLRALETLAVEKGTRFFLAPPLGGWTGVYPSDHGQDVTVSAAIAARVSEPVIHLLVHDDDVFAYTLYNTGGRIDEYCSDPDYFEPSPPERWHDTAGRPEALAALVRDGNSAELNRVLDRKEGHPDPFRARWQLERIGGLLGIANLETSYEYLREGETKGIKGWKDFRHIPDPTAEKEAARRRRSDITATLRRLQHEGRLLLTMKRAGVHPQFPLHPASCVDPAGGFFLAWRDPNVAETELEEWKPPWREPSPTGLRINSRVQRLRASQSRRFLAVGHASGEWSATLFDVHERRVLTTVPLPRATDHISFSQDERTLVCRSQGELLLVRTADGHVMRSMALPGGRSAAMHPDGRWLVADVQGQHGSGLAIVDVDAGGSSRVLRTKQHDLGAWRAAHAAGQRALTGFHPTEVPNKVEFTPDGRLLVMAVQEGVRAYWWEEVLRMTEDLPAPVVSADSDLVPIDRSWAQNTYAIAIDSNGERVLFSGLDGHVRALDIRSGKASTLLEVPGAPPVTELELSTDGKTLATTAYPGMFHRGRRQAAPLWQVWNVTAATS
jgi:hypothetical protein